MPRIQEVLRDFEQRKKDESWNSAKSQVEVTREFLDEHFIFRLVRMKTHNKTGDLAIVKMFETGYKRIGYIQPVKIVQQQAQQIAPHDGTMKQIYKSKWLREKEEQLRQELEAGSQTD